MQLTLVPIDLTDKRITDLHHDPECRSVLERMPAFYAQIGFEVPWIGYFIERENVIVGSCAFKGKPQDGKVEIAYTTFPTFQRAGIASEACRMLVRMALETASVIVTAYTLAEDNTSTRVLKRNGFEFAGNAFDEEDQLETWLWTYSSHELR